MSRVGLCLLGMSAVTMLYLIQPLLQLRDRLRSASLQGSDSLLHAGAVISLRNAATGKYLGTFGQEHGSRFGGFVGWDPTVDFTDKDGDHWTAKWKVSAPVHQDKDGEVYELSTMLGEDGYLFLLYHVQGVFFVDNGDTECDFAPSQKVSRIDGRTTTPSIVNSLNCRWVPTVDFQPKGFWKPVSCNADGAIQATISQRKENLATLTAEVNAEVGAQIHDGCNFGMDADATVSASASASLSVSFEKSSTTEMYTAVSCDHYDQGSKFRGGCMWQWAMEMHGPYGQVNWNAGIVTCTRDMMPPRCPAFEKPVGSGCVDAGEVELATSPHLSLAAGRRDDHSALYDWTEPSFVSWHSRAAKVYEPKRAALLAMLDTTTTNSAPSSCATLIFAAILCASFAGLAARQLRSSQTHGASSVPLLAE